jgi:hypothetical protein
MHNAYSIKDSAKARIVRFDIRIIFQCRSMSIKCGQAQKCDRVKLVNGMPFILQDDGDLGIESVHNKTY